MRHSKVVIAARVVAALTALVALVVTSSVTLVGESPKQQTTARWDAVYVTHFVNGHPLPFATRFAAAPGTSHWVELEGLTLRLEQKGRFTVLVRYRHDVLRGRRKPGRPPILDATFRGNFVRQSDGRLVLYPDPGSHGQRRVPWTGSVRGERVVMSRAVLDGTQSRSFTFELVHDPTIY